VHQEICETNHQVVRAKRVASAWQLKCQAVLVGVRTVLIQRLGCFVGSVWGNQHLCMQRQSFLASNCYAGQHPKPPYWFLRRKHYIGSQTKDTLHLQGASSQITKTSSSLRRSNICFDRVTSDVFSYCFGGACLQYATQLDQNKGYECVQCKANIHVSATTRKHAWASAEIFPRGCKVDILLIFFGFLTMQRKLTYTKKKMSSNSCIQCFPCKKILHCANVCFSEHGYFKTELAEF